MTAVHQGNVTRRVKNARKSVLRRRRSALLLTGALAALLAGQGAPADVTDYTFLDSSDQGWSYGRTTALTDAGVLLGAPPPPASDHGAYIGMMTIAPPPGVTYTNSGFEMQFYAPDSPEPPTDGYEFLAMFHDDPRDGFTVGKFEGGDLHGTGVTRQQFDGPNSADANWAIPGNNGLVGMHTLAMVRLDDGTLNTYMDGVLVNSRVTDDPTQSLEFLAIGQNVNGNNYMPFGSVVTRAQALSFAPGSFDPSALIPITTWNGGAGAWQDAGNPWSKGGSAVNWTDGSDAVFGNGGDTAGDVTITGTVKPQSLSFNNTGSGSYRLVPGVGGKIDLDGGTRVITVAPNAGAEIATEITHGKLVKSGDGLLNLTAANTYAGGTTLVMGALQFASGASLGSGNVTFQGGTLRYGPGLTTDVSGRINPVGAGQTAKIDTNGNDVAFGTAISGDGGLSKLGAGTLALTVNHTYTGPTTVYEGGLDINTGTVATLNVVGGTATVKSGAVAAVANVSGGLLALNAGGVATSANVTGGQVALNGSVSQTLGVGGGTVTVGPGAAVQNAALNGGTVNAANPLAIAHSLTTAGAIASFTPGGGATAFTVSGGNIGDDSASRTVTLSGGTLVLGVPTVAAGLDVRAWQGVDGQIDGSLFNLPGSPTHSTFAGTLGYATSAIHLEGDDAEHFTRSGSGVITGPMPTGYADNYTVEYRGKLFIPVAGTYSFSTTSDDGSALWIDPSGGNPGYGSATVQNDGYKGMGQANSGALSLGAGYHDIIVRYYEGGGGNGLYVQWDPAGGGSFEDIPGSDFRHVTGGVTAANLPNTHIALTATSALSLGDGTGNAVLGDLSLDGGGTTLNLSGAQRVSFNSITATGNSQIAAGVPIAIRTGNVTASGGQSLAINAPITNGDSPTAINKLGAGKATINAVSNYSGATSVTEGVLEVGSAGKIDSTSGLAINGAGAEFKYNASAPYNGGPIALTQGTLSGTGTINRHVAGGTGTFISPGNSPGAQTYSNGLDFSAGMTYIWQLGSYGTHAGTDSDLINITAGNLQLGGQSTLSLSFVDAAGNPDNGNPFWNSAHTWTLIDVTGSGANSSGLNLNFTQLVNGAFLLGHFNTTVASDGDILLSYHVNTDSTFAVSPANPVHLGNVLRNGVAVGGVSVTNNGAHDAGDYSTTNLSGVTITGGASDTGVAPGDSRTIAFKTSGAFSGANSPSLVNHSSGSFVVHNDITGDDVAPSVIITANVGLAVADSSDSQHSFGPGLSGVVAPGGVYDGLESTVDSADGLSGAAVLHSVATILAGTNDVGGVDRNVTMQWRTRTTGEAGGLVSDVVDITGMDGTTFVLQMNYIDNNNDGYEDINGFGATTLFIAYLNDQGQWINAITGNHGSNANGQHYAGFDMGWASAQGGNGQLTLGSYGVDTFHHVVWAVLDHNSQFAVIPAPAALPGGLMLLTIAAAFKRRRNA